MKDSLADLLVAAKPSIGRRGIEIAHLDDDISNLINLVSDLHTPVTESSKVAESVIPAAPRKDFGAGVGVGGRVTRQRAKRQAK